VPSNGIPRFELIVITATVEARYGPEIVFAFKGRSALLVSGVHYLNAPLAGINGDLIHSACRKTL
jgi:hypothetical protein